MFLVRYAQEADWAFWSRLDQRLPEREFRRKVRDRMGYVAEVDGACVGLLRYGLFWDEIPFCTLLYVEQGHRGTGCGKALMSRWETDMCAEGHGLFMTSTQADEAAQHFYRRLGYRDAGCLLLDSAGYAQPTELFFTKTAGRS